MSKPKHLLLFLTSVVFSVTALAENRQEVFDRYLDFGALVKGGSVRASWLGDGSGFWYAEGAPANTVIWTVDPAANSKEPLFDTARLRAALAGALGYEPPYKGVPFSQLALSPDGGTASFALEGGQFMLDLNSYAVTRVPGPDPMAMMMGNAPELRRVPGTFPSRGYFGAPVPMPEPMSPDGQWFATLIDENVVIRATADGRNVPLTHNGSSDDAWGIQAVSYGASMFGQTTPVSSWSPNSLKLWATRTDRSKLPRLPEVHYQKTRIEWDERPFTIAGGELDHVRPYIIDILSGEAIALSLGGEEDGGADGTSNYYFSLLAWLPDSSEVLFARTSRNFKTIEIMAANTSDGSVRTLFSETAKTFVKLQHSVISGVLGFSMLPDNKGFLWASTRDGWEHLYHYDLNGKLLRQVTRGDWPVLAVTDFDAQSGWVYFTAHGETPRVYDTHLYRVALSGGKVERLTEAEGQHSVQMSPSKDWFIDTHSSTKRPPVSELRSADGRLVRVLAEADISALQALGWTPTEEFTVKAADGETDLWGVMHKPYDFDPDKQYPVLEFLYAGPMIALADYTFSVGSAAYSNMPRAMAQLGYIVVTLDARGTPGRSKAFQDVVYQAWGRNEIPDHAGAVRQLAQQHNFMDIDRVGIWGHSWGGHFAFRALAQAPDLYKAAVSSAPGYDPYGSLLYEPYLDMPDKAREAYDYASPFRLAPQIKGKLMIAGGTADFATFGEFMKMSRALIDAGIQHDQVVLPGEGHGYTGIAADYYAKALAAFFAEHLQTQ